jgi:hypothetical protein
VSPDSKTQNYATTYVLPAPDNRTGYKFTNWTLSGYGSLSGNTYTYGAGAGKVTANWSLDVTAPSPPSNFSISSQAKSAIQSAVAIAKAGNTVTLAWSGAVAGINNSIDHYEIDIRQNLGGSYGGWSLWKTASGTSCDFSIGAGELGNDYSFRIRAVGTNSAAYYSSYWECPEYLSIMGLPNAPTSVIINPARATAGNYTVSWSGASTYKSVAGHYSN